MSRVKAINPAVLPAKAEDAPILRQIAIQSKGHWGYPAHWMDQFSRASIITAESIGADVVYTASADEGVVGWYRLLPQLPTAILEDLWVLPAWIGQGIGRALWQHAAAQAQLLGARAVELEADPNAAPFYQRMGFRVVGQSLSEWGRYVPRMRYELRDLLYNRDHGRLIEKP
jgi:GNAT superfamily N-acetyltransferase